MEWFNICHVRLSDHPATMAHWDVARLLFHSFESLGKKVTLQVNRLENAATNIIVGYERVNMDEAIRRVRYIPYQLEQLAPGGISLSDAMQNLLTGAAQVWDFSTSNAEALSRIGIHNVKLLPLGFHEKLATIQPSANEDVDVLFYGLLNDRRKKILEAIQARGLAVQVLQGVFGDERDAWIARSGLVINIHFYPTKLPEQVRISYLLNNRRCVLSEESVNDPFESLCANVPYDALADTAFRLVNAPEERHRISTTGFEAFRQHPMVEHLRRVLE